MGVAQQIGRLVGHVLSASVKRDGSAPMLQGEAFAEGRVLAADVARSAAASARPMTVSSSGLLLDSLSAKILGAWLQNRHQTLYPLAMNFRNIEPARIAILLEVAAVALLATGDLGDDGLARVHAWLATVGGLPSHRELLAAAVADAPTLHGVFGRVLDAHLGPFAFAVALAALDQRNAVNRSFLEYMALRLGLPSDVSRSLAQRYRL